MNFELVRIAAALLGTGVAAWQDYKTSFIDDRVVYAMIFLGLILDVLTFDQDFIIYSVGIAAGIFAFGYLLYRTGQLGGGDVLLFAGIQLLLPYYPQAAAALGIAPQPYLFIPFVISVLAASSFYALLGTAVQFGIKLRGRSLKPDAPSAVVALFILAAMLYAASVAGGGLMINAFFAAMVIPGAFLLVFKKQITDELIVKRIRISQIEDEDVLATERMPEAIVKKYSLGRVLTKPEVEKLKRIERSGKMRSFPVYKDLPRFGPYILAALITCLLVGDPFVYLVLH